MGAVKAKLHDLIERSDTFSMAIVEAQLEGLASPGSKFMLGEMWHAIKDPQFSCPQCDAVNQFTAYFKDKEKKELGSLFCDECSVQLSDHPEVLTSDTVVRITSKEVELLAHMPFSQEPQDRTISEHAYEFLSRAYTKQIELVTIDTITLTEEGSSAKDAISDLIKLGKELRIDFWEHIKETYSEFDYVVLQELYNEQDE